MNASSSRLLTKPEGCRAGGGSRPQDFAAIMLGLLLLIGCFTPVPRLAGAPPPPFPDKRDPNATPESTGPTLHLSDDPGGSPANTVAGFMYFVPLISLEPVSVIKSPRNTQRTRMLSTTRSSTARSFLVTSEFEFNGEGNQRYVFDHSEKIRRHERELREGASLDHQLGSISVAGAGRVRVEVEGTMIGQVATVTEVRVRFNVGGRPSLVTISLQDFEYSRGEIRVRNETVARVNTLIFRRKPGPPKMDITVAAVKRKNAGDNLWQSVMGGLKATTANLLLKPIAVEPDGNEAMLDFGFALASEAPSFSFPLASNLQAESIR